MLQRRLDVGLFFELIKNILSKNQQFYISVMINIVRCVVLSDEFISRI